MIPPSRRTHGGRDPQKICADKFLAKAPAGKLDDQPSSFFQLSATSFGGNIKKYVDRWRGLLGRLAVCPVRLDGDRLSHIAAGCRRSL